MAATISMLGSAEAQRPSKAELVGDGSQDALLLTLKQWFRSDSAHAKKWRTEAKEDFDFVAGEQWSEADKTHLKNLMRPIITFNRVQPVINSISGQEIGNRQEVRYLPREQGDVKQNEVLTEAAHWFRDLAEADDEDSDAFLNSTICGMGWTETTLDYSEDEEGQPRVDCVNPLEMYWDKGARKKNLLDGERVWRVKKIPMKRAKKLFPDAQESDLDAGWARLDETESPSDQDKDDLYNPDDSDEPGTTDGDKSVTIVHCQYRMHKTVHIVVDPMTGQKSELSSGDFRKMKERFKEIGLSVSSTKVSRGSIKDCFIGSVVLQHEDALCDKHFRFQCVTAYQEKNKGTFYGMVRAMKDPQRWANKWMSQALDLLNSQAKGGVIMEDGAVDDQRKFEKTWARADVPSVVKAGTLSNANGARIIPKPAGAFPAGFFQLMEFAISSVPDVSGVSIEMMGLREANQPGVLEQQRKQASMTILQPLFGNLKRYRREHGKIMLYLIQNYLSDGRLIRIVGEGGAQYVPLVREADVKYDIVVDDAPTSPNQKENIWGMVGEKFWDLPAEIQMVLLEYSPFPSSVVQKVRETAEQMKQGPQAELAQRMAQIEAALKEAEVQTEQAEAAKKAAEAKKIESEIGQTSGGDKTTPALIRAGTEVARMKLKEAEKAAELGVKREGMALDAQLKREQMAQSGEGGEGGEVQMPMPAPPSDTEMLSQALAAIAKGQQTQTMALQAIVQGQSQTTQTLAQVAQAHDQGNIALGEAVQSLGEQMGGMGQLQTQIISAITAPKKLVRDEEGRPAGVVTEGGI